jgi:hypothetical protein
MDKSFTSFELQNYKNFIDKKLQRFHIGAINYAQIDK